MIIGREEELKYLNKTAIDDNSHFIAIYGRRRVGKTFLIREGYGGRFTFSHAGIYNGRYEDQLRAFESSLKDAGVNTACKFDSWFAAFDSLKDLIRNSNEKKKVIFIDELSWMDTPKSNLIMALENFWNGWASARKDVVLVICASATSWMLSKVIHNKGGLYNRLTGKIHLSSFSLAECEEYVKASGLSLSREQILQYYMIFGGIPYYWGFLQKGMSLSQNIDYILFSKDAPLKDEYKYLYAAIFKNPEVYQTIIEALGTKKVGMTREEIIEATGIENSGALTSKLEELESCGFIRVCYSFGKVKKNAIYQLIDNFTLFYHSFMCKNNNDEHFWSNQINTPAVNSWMGLAFERVCLLHIDQIKQKLGIAGILTEVNSWYCKADPDKGIQGSQIDLLIARRDQVINLCEMKYSGAEYTVTEKVDRDIRRKISDLKLVTKTKSAVFPTLVTTYGIVENAYSGNVQSVITMNDLFHT